MGFAPAAKLQTFGKYSLVAKLATGGMAEIFLARFQGAAGFEKLVVIKRILPHLAKDQHLVEMFLAEAKIAAQINHPNVCQVFELGEIDGAYFIAMEYLEGVPFACFRRREMYPAHPDPRLIAGIGVQACEGLHHAHNLKRPDGSPFEVIHRDVSANNLFVTVDGVVKVLDFGIAKVQDASVRTSTGSVKGTYAYMAPEQLRGERLDRRTDVFAMGIVLWELFARRHLFKRDTEFLTFQAITTDPIPDIGEFRPDVPPDLAATIAKALSRSADDRYPTARALGEALVQSVLLMGGPFSPSAISEELCRAFDERLRDQQELIRIAREGGALELDTDHGPGIGHGTALMTTPVSVTSTRGSIPGVPKPAPSMASNRTPVPGGPRSASMPVAMPHAPAGSGPRIGVIVLTLIALGAIGAAVFFYLQTRASPPAEPERVTMTVMAADAMPIAATPDAAIASPVRPDAAIAAAIPADAAEEAPPIDAPRAKERRPTRPDRTPPRPSGPPGFITIDASPIYAIVFIDGKRIGETPLVRIKLSPGRHRVRAVSPSGASRSFTIQIEPGKVARTKRIEW